ncbi:cytochrome P450 [Mycena latifolia]|nr:cytochrome P450 [Mycena latifolia]
MSYGIIAAGSIAILVLYVVFPRRSTIQNLVGPPSPSWIFGNMLQLMVPPQYGDHEFRWQRLYGAVYRVKGCFGQDRLMVSDPAALQYILNSPLFEHAPMLDNKVHLMFGEHSVSAAKGDTHKRLRAAMNPSFTAAAVRNYQPLIESVAQTITEELEETSDPESMDICPLLNAAALDAVSKGMSQYHQRIQALASIQSAGHILADAIGAYIPAWILAMAVHLPTAGFEIIRKAKYLSNRLGRKIVQEKVDSVRQGLELNDVFGLLLSTEKSRNTKNTLTREELAAQTAIILVAGQDTTANTLTLGLLELARNPEFQDKLRAEVHSARAGNRHLAYDTLPLLNAFIKEVLRKYPAAPLLDRIAVQDTIVPLMESVVTSSGDSIKYIPIRKGQIVTVVSASYHSRLESRWGADAHEFKPSRWLEGAACRGEAVGPYATLLTFLGGPRPCLGWRFGLLVMQAIICELVDKFSFALPEGSAVRVRVANTLIPIDATGKKAAHLRLTRI